MNLLRTLVFVFISISSFGQNRTSDNNQFTDLNGIRYKVVRHGTGKKIERGNIVGVNVIAAADTSELVNTYKTGTPGVIRADNVGKKGDWQIILPKLTQGDSVLVEVSCDTILAENPDAANAGPAWLRKGNKVTMTVSVVSVRTEEEYRKEAEIEQKKKEKEAKEKEAKQMPIDDKILQEYFAKNKLSPKKTASGLYYTITAPGSGAKVIKGQTIAIKYTGKTLDGKVFDSNIDPQFKHTEPLGFVAGKGQMIRGMDEGVTLLKLNGKATLYLPSPLAYGSKSASNDIPANSILIFDIEIVEIK